MSSPPPLAAGRPTPPVDVLGVPVERGPVPAPWPAAVDAPPTLWADADRLLFRSSPDAAVYVEGGCRLVLDAPPGGGHDWLAYSTGARALLGQQRRFNLHGTLVTAPSGRTVAILGESMAGKSTTTVELVRRGWSLACDDIVEVRLAGGRAVAHPVERPVHLSDAAAAGLGLDVGTGIRLAPTAKRAYVLDADPAPRSLDALVWLRQAEGVEAVQCRAVSALAALPLVARASDRYGVFQLPGLRADFLSWVTELVRVVPLVEMVRPRAGDSVDEVVAAVAQVLA